MLKILGSNLEPLCIDIHSTQPTRTSYAGKLIHMSQLVFFVDCGPFKIDASSMVTFFQLAHFL